MAANIDSLIATVLDGSQFKINSTRLDRLDTTGEPGPEGQGVDGLLTNSGQRLDNDRVLASDVLLFIQSEPADFTNDQLYSELCVRTRREKKTVCAALYSYEKQGKIRKIEGKRGHWEIVEDKPKVMDLLSANVSPLNIPLPLDISDYVSLRPGVIVLVAGANNSGKTLFLLSIVQQILTHHVYSSLYLEKKEMKPLCYLNSEMGCQELVSRISRLGGDPAEWIKHIDFIERSHSFERVINPDGINFVDYLECHTDFFLVGKMVADIHRKLKTGIAFLASQKKSGSEYSKGGEMVQEKPRLSINLDKNEPYGFTCKITKLKEPKDFTKNIQGMTRDFVITKDSKMLPISGWRYVNDLQRRKINDGYSKTHIHEKVRDTGAHYKTA
jgi:hypothetical protein